MVYLEEKGKDSIRRVKELRVEWKRLWKERLDDQVRVEGIAKEDYQSLFIERAP